ncbi:MAG: aminopeptidase [Desulfobacteraceae bacterium]|nr:aminopeptidase [Desulfobacteraceae bacterium]
MYLILKKLIIGVVLTGCLLIAGCVSPSYYAHVSYHHLKLINDREPVETIINMPDTPKDLKGKLILTQKIRSFASRQLLLPDNDSYTTYTDLKRPYLMWNVLATPELSLEPVAWDFLFAGRLSYRGFYTLKKAESFAKKLREKGYDVNISSVPAYSTLGWFDDPLLSSFIHWPQAELGSLIFHELAHQKLYVKGDTSFNESFAEMVAEHGLHLWFKAQKDPEAMDHYLKSKAQYQVFIDLLMGTAKELHKLYDSSLSKDQKRLQKQAVFSELKQKYSDLKKGDQSFKRFDHWFSKEMNNARFALLSTYHGYVPAFQALLKKCNGDLERFYEEAVRLGKLSKKERQDALTFLAGK